MSAKKITEIPIIKRFTGMCNDGWLQGWHERNGGNLTYRMTENDVEQCRKFFLKPQEWTEMGVCDTELAGEYFITTGSGKYFRNVELDPAANIGIVEINSKGSAQRIVWGLENNSRPTSEFPTHFMNHAVRKKATNNQNRVIYHAHPANIIAMTYILPLTAKDFTLALWRSATECPVVFPDGIGVVLWHVPGGAEIALATSKIMENFSAAVWAHHGLFCSGADFDETFGLMHTIEKAAEIYMKVQSSQLPVLQTISNDNLLAIAKAFNTKLNNSFL
jgi:rhamnulose-1-phosphate aldolase